MSRPRGINGLLGEAVNPASETWLQQRRYNFDVERKPVLYRDAGGVLQDVGKRVVLVRKDTQQPLAVVSKSYKPVLHGELIDALDSKFSAQGLDFTRRLAVRNGGARMMVEYTFPDVKTEVKPGDFVNMTLVGGNSFDTTMPVWMKIGAFRLICTNGAIIGKILAVIAKKHNWAFDMGNIIADVTKAARVFFDESDNWARYATIPVSSWKVRSFLNLLVEEKEITQKTADAILFEFDSPSRGQRELTAWGFYNAVTSVGSHQARGVDPIFNLLSKAGVYTERLLTEGR